MSLLILVCSLVILGILLKEDKHPVQEKEVPVGQVLNFGSSVKERKASFIDFWEVHEDEEEDKPVIDIDYKEYYREAFRESFKRRRIDWEESIRQEAYSRTMKDVDWSSILKNVG